MGVCVYLHTCVCTHTEEISQESCVGKVAEAPGSHRQVLIRQERVLWHSVLV